MTTPFCKVAVHPLWPIVQRARVSAHGTSGKSRVECSPSLVGLCGVTSVPATLGGVRLRGAVVHSG